MLLPKTVDAPIGRGVWFVQYVLNVQEVQTVAPPVM
jgi:hypothetical protein